MPKLPKLPKQQAEKKARVERHPDKQLTVDEFNRLSTKAQIEYLTQNPNYILDNKDLRKLPREVQDAYGKMRAKNMEELPGMLPGAME